MMDNKAEKQKLWRQQKREYRKNRKEYILILGLQEAERLENLAKNKNMSSTEFIKSVIKKQGSANEYIVPKDGIMRDLIIEIRRIGTNINQIARHINTNKMISIEQYKLLRGHLFTIEKTIITALTNPPKKL